MRGRPAARVQMVTPTAAWLRPFVAAVRRSRALHGRWVSPPASPAAYRAYLRLGRGPAGGSGLGRDGEPAHPMSRARESAGRTNVTRPFTARGDGVPQR
jgi:hypothetical protein